MKRALSTSALVIVAAVGGVAACDGVAGPDGGPVSLTFTVPRSSSSSEAGVALQSAAPDRAVTVSDGTRRLRVDVMQLNIARIDLERVDDLDDTDTDRDTDWGMDSDRDTDTDEGDNIRFRGPVTVDLPLAGGTITPFRTTIPVGLYDEVEFRVRSARIVGAFDEDRDGVFEDAERFDEVVQIREKFEIALRPPLVIDEDTDAANVTVALALSECFRDGNGSLFNPRRLNNEKQLRARFRQLIRHALRAFEDSNRNGDDDRDTDSDHR